MSGLHESLALLSPLEKWEIVESLWADLLRTDAGLESPPWHLAEVTRRLQSDPGTSGQDWTLAEIKRDFEGESPSAGFHRR